MRGEPRKGALRHSNPRFQNSLKVLKSKAGEPGLRPRLLYHEKKAAIIQKNDADKAFEDSKQAVKDAEELIELPQKGLN